jgi:hypothetical protein
VEAPFQICWGGGEGAIFLCFNQEKAEVWFMYKEGIITVAAETLHSLKM